MTSAGRAVATRKPTKTALRIKADTLFSQKVRAAGRCARCGAADRLQCAHIVSRRYLCTRWDKDNAICLCAGCHMYFTHRPLEWEEWITSRIGTANYEELKRKALGTCKPDYPEILAEIKRAA